MNEQTRETRGTIARHLRAAHLWRFRQIARTIPRDCDPARRADYLLFAFKWCGILGKRQLATVVWPWQPRQPSVSPHGEHRGRARRNLLRTMAAAGLRVPRGKAA